MFSALIFNYPKNSSGYFLSAPEFVNLPLSFVIFDKSDNTVLILWAHEKSGVAGFTLVFFEQFKMMLFLGIYVISV